MSDARNAQARVAAGSSAETELQASPKDSTDRVYRTRRCWLAVALLGGWLPVEHVASRVRADIEGGRP